jgi:hypothetical protein
MQVLSFSNQDQSRDRLRHYLCHGHFRDRDDRVLDFV